MTGDGEATVFEGSALVAAFVIMAAVAAFETRPPAWSPPLAALGTCAGRDKRRLVNGKAAIPAPMRHRIP